MSSSNAHHETAQTKAAMLRERASKFCEAFLDLGSNPPDKILADHFVPGTPKVTEHGPASVAKALPFLGKTFAGRDQFLEYFRLLSETLAFTPKEGMFGDKDNIAVDENATGGQHGRGSGSAGRGVVTVSGRAVFKAVSTGKEWDEIFVWRLSDFDENGKIGHWEIWADPLSAWLAVRGEDVA